MKPTWFSYRTRRKKLKLWLDVFTAILRLILVLLHIWTLIGS